MRPLGNILNLRGNNNNNNNNASQSKKAEKREKNNARATKFGQAVNENRALQRFPQLTYVSHAAAALVALVVVLLLLVAPAVGQQSCRIELLSPLLASLMQNCNFFFYRNAATF